MSQVITIGAILLFYFLRFLISSLNNKNADYLFVSIFITTIPFQINFTILESTVDSMGGTLGNKTYVYLPLVLFFLFSFIQKPTIRSRIKSFGDRWVIWTLILIFVSFFNPGNNFLSGTMIFFIFFLSHILLFNQYSKKISKDQIIKGILDGLIVLCLIQFVLAICFPLLNMLEVTTLFHTFGIEGATRFGTRAGAIGTFVHPGNLGLFLIMASCFFFVAYLKNYKKSLFKYVLMLNTFTLFLTYSRTSYLALVLSLFLVYVLHKNAQRRILTISNTLKYLLPLILLLAWLIFLSPLSESFLKSDSGDQLNNRLVHYFMAYNALSESPIFGVGLNTHVELFMNKLSLSNSITLDNFFLSNPIHNIHLIILVETGIFGFILWLVFLAISFKKSKEQLKKKENEFINLGFIGVLFGFIFYGLTGWAPLSQGIFPFFLLFTFFTYRFNNS